MPSLQLTTLKKYVRSYDVNVRPDSTASEFAIAVGRYVPRLWLGVHPAHVARHHAPPRPSPSPQALTPALRALLPFTVPRHFDSYLDVEEPDVLRKFMNYVRWWLCCAPFGPLLRLTHHPRTSQVKKQAIIDPIVRRSTRKEREAKLARRKRARKNLVR